MKLLTFQCIGFFYSARNGLFNYLTITKHDIDLYLDSVVVVWPCGSTFPSLNFFLLSLKFLPEALFSHSLRFVYLKKKKKGFKRFYVQVDQIIIDFGCKSKIKHLADWIVFCTYVDCLLFFVRFNFIFIKKNLSVVNNEMWSLVI